MEYLPALFELAKAYHVCKDPGGLAKTFAAHLGKTLECRGVSVWFLLGPDKDLVFSGGWSEPGVRYAPLPGPATDGILPAIVEEPRARRFSAAELEADDLAHFAEHDRERIQSALYAPIIGLKGPGGAVEVLNHKSGKFSAEEAAYVEEAARITGRSLETMCALDEERQDSLNTIERLTSLYDISRVFNSTLELEDLLPVVADRICNIIGAQACNVWLVDSDENDLYFAQQVGDDPSTDEEDRLPLGEGVIGKVAQTGKPLLFDDATEEELLEERRKRASEFEITTLMAAPMLKEEEVLGVIEVVNKLDGSPFNKEELYFLKSLTQQAAIALNNANLLEAERKVGELDALLAIGKEITSTLNLDHVLTTVVHQAATVVPFERCAIGLYDRNKFILGAVSGEKEVPQTKEMRDLREVMDWIGHQQDAVSADNYEDGWKVEPESAKSAVTRYCDAHEVNGFYAVPLKDDQGTVGVLAMLSSEAEFLSERHLEMIGILASQTTVAIRNARLYAGVPLMSFWQPIAKRKAKLAEKTRGRQIELSVKIGLVLLFLIAIPVKLRIATSANVVPVEKRAVSAEVAGVIEKVAVREGDMVDAGTVLASLNESDAVVKLAAAQANLDNAQRQMTQAETRGDLGAASQARLRAEMHRSELDLYQQKLEKAQLLAPISGQVVTPKVEERVGQMLEQGDHFCELVELDQMAAELNVPETQVTYVRAGSPVTLKLNALPTTTLTGTVTRVSPVAISAEGEQFFVVRAVFDNPERKARPGMVGRGKISAAGGWLDSGWYPIGYVIFRTPARWGWQKIWEWLP